MIVPLRRKNTDEGVLFYFDTQVERDAFVRTVDALGEPIRDPDGPTATARLLEIREWCDKHDPWGATAGGFVVRLLRGEMNRRIYGEPRWGSELP